MNLTGIISISGKSGLFKVVGQGKSNLIVESLQDGKRFPAFSTNKVSSLDDISIYTKEEDLPLGEVVRKIWDDKGGEAGPDHNAEIEELRSYLEGIVPNYDEERVYSSDIRKLFQWYNLLHKSGTLQEMVDAEQEESEDAKDDKTADSEKKEGAEVKTTGKATEEEATSEEKEKPKKAAPKKPAAKKKPAEKANGPKSTAAKTAKKSTTAKTTADKSTSAKAAADKKKEE